MSEDLDAIFRYVLNAKGAARRDAVGIYADALEAAGDHDRAWMFRQTDCPLGMSPKELREESRSRVVMQRIRAGEFLMGSPDDVGIPLYDEKPRHKVILTKDFALGVFPVTQDQYERVTLAHPSPAAERSPTPSHNPGNPDHPVERVSWWDAVHFCNLLSLMEKKRPYYAIGNDAVECDADADADGYRLPTEAEWEFACRAGTTTIWPWGDTDADLGDYAWYQANTGASTHPSGEKRPNGWGLYDTLGNVWEWCFDSWPRRYLDSDVQDPSYNEGPCRVYRGGCWDGNSLYVRPACRQTFVPKRRNRYVGFRVAGNIP